MAQRVEHHKRPSILVNGRVLCLCNSQKDPPSVPYLTPLKGESTMTKQNFEWVESLDEAQSIAKENGKLILLDFFNPG
jgi:hypothetical protein